MMTPASTLTSTELQRLHPAIELSWRRSRMCGVDPRTQIDRLDLTEVDSDAPLLTAARPVLRRMLADLGELPVAVLLAGRDGLVLDVLTTAGRGPLADMARTRIGRRCTEEQVGTNSIGTALELGRGIHIRGEEHYLESLRALNCWGAPIEHPMSGRTEGVLSICGADSTPSAGLGPFLSYAARDIRERLLAEAPRRHLELLSAFQIASRQHRAVLVLGTDMVLATPAATAMLEPIDHVRLREYADGLGRDDVLREDVAQLASGATVSLTIRRCGGGLLITIGRPGTEPRITVPRGPNARFSTRHALAGELAAARDGRLRTLLTGEAGTGRSTAVRELAAEVREVDCAGASRPGWKEQLVEALTGPDLVVLDGIEALPRDTALWASNRIVESDAWVAMTGPSAEQLSGDHAALVACCEVHVHLQPLRTRTAELPVVLREMTDAIAGKPLRWTSEALAALAGHRWPGNLHELRAVIQHVAQSAEDDCATVRTLPCSIVEGPGRTLNPLQRSEREVIAATLSACHGNKVHAAAHLGISRTTLYKRLRALDLS